MTLPYPVPPAIAAIADSMSPTRGPEYLLSTLPIGGVNRNRSLEIALIHRRIDAMDDGEPPQPRRYLHQVFTAASRSDREL